MSNRMLSERCEFRLMGIWLALVFVAIHHICKLRLASAFTTLTFPPEATELDQPWLQFQEVANICLTYAVGVEAKFKMK